MSFRKLPPPPAPAQRRLDAVLRSGMQEKERREVAAKAVAEVDIGDALSKFDDLTLDTEAGPMRVRRDKRVEWIQELAGHISDGTFRVTMNDRAIYVTLFAPGYNPPDEFQRTRQARWTEMQMQRIYGAIDFLITEGFKFLADDPSSGTLVYTWPAAAAQPSGGLEGWFRLNYPQWDRALREYTQYKDARMRNMRMAKEAESRAAAAAAQEPPPPPQPDPERQPSAQSDQGSILDQLYAAAARQPSSGSDSSEDEEAAERARFLDPAYIANLVQNTFLAGQSLTATQIKLLIEYFRRDVLVENPGANPLAILGGGGGGLAGGSNDPPPDTRDGPAEGARAEPLSMGNGLVAAMARILQVWESYKKLILLAYKTDRMRRLVFLASAGYTWGFYQARVPMPGALGDVFVTVSTTRSLAARQWQNGQEREYNLNALFSITVTFSRSLVAIIQRYVRSKGYSGSSAEKVTPARLATALNAIWENMDAQQRAAVNALNAAQWQPPAVGPPEKWEPEPKGEYTTGAVPPPTPQAPASPADESEPDDVEDEPSSPGSVQ